MVRPFSSTAVRAPNCLVAISIGMAYLLGGVVIGAVALGTGIASGHPAGACSPARVVGYLALGAVLILAALCGRAKQVNSLLGAAYVVLGVILVFTVGAEADLMALDRPDNLLHLGSAAVLLGFGRTQD